ncbi:hypothetical protein K437DRAFT_296702 [Tilletiaria anomala UBC 951]|uniref:Uncharacterized protein n=1 Tax=Tilletiaria anomala (strain ATCC 24038 / CBS 436.72 / UBC 951) TaxID=1037660 RepID=A0A066V592_TILAU|nr:uncharacterized protein K437DRAFT_296702 [Tilletiaria anomala UBC 951]KDN36882.1 hypothetical protein K437DRAFT_296702 [Tilletiaria anomala UBC 951]
MAPHSTPSSDPMGSVPLGTGTSAAPGPAAVFPAVSVKELTEFMPQIGLNLSPDEIANPSATTAHKVFIAFLQALSGMDEETVSRQKTRALGQMEYKEMFESSYSQLVLFREIKEMLSCAMIHDFGLSDMTRPQKNRFKRQLSALHNFMLHRHDRIQEFDELVGRSEDLVAERDQLKMELAQKEHELAKIKEQEKMEVPEVEAVLAHNMSLQETLERLKIAQEKGMRELEHLLETKDAYEKERIAIEERIHELITDVERLKQRIRQSPDELMKKVKNVEGKLGKAKLELEEKERILKSQTKKRHGMLIIEEELKALMTAMTSVQAELQRTRKEASSLDELSTLITSNESELSELTFQHKQMQQKISVDTARAERLRAALEQKRDMWKRRNEELGAVVQEKQALKKGLFKEAGEKDRLCKEVEREIEEIHLQHRAQILKMQEEKESLSRLADSYMTAIGQSLGIAV